MSFTIKNEKSRIAIFIVFEDELARSEKIQDFITVIGGILKLKHEIYWEIMVLGGNKTNIAVKENEEAVRTGIDNRTFGKDILFIFVGEGSKSIEHIENFKKILKNINDFETTDFILYNGKIKDMVNSSLIKILKSEFKKIPVS